MTWRSSSDIRPIGVIGAGNFGSAVANLLARNGKVLLYARDKKVIQRINDKGENRGHIMHKNIVPTDDLIQVAKECEIIFPIVPSEHFESNPGKISIKPAVELITQQASH
jgi:glycerol-3-phosphate dehydrogenase (NAD(P)+)